MVANYDRTCPLVRRVLGAASAFAVAFSLSAAAQTSSAPSTSGSAQGYSSSADYQAYLSTDSLLGGSSSPAPAALAAASPSPSPQYGGGRSNYPSYPNYNSRWSHLAFVGGGGFSSPIGNDTHGFETWGYNLDVGAGWNFSKKFGVLFEYQFDRMKIPGSTIAQVGAQGGNINSHLFLFDPIYYFMARKTTGAYLTGGAGYSRKVTNFTDLQTGEVCYYFCYYENVPQTVASFSSNQFAADAGLGLYWKAFGADSNAKLFAEARYIWVNSPKSTATQNGEGTEGLIPVTFGIRF